MDYDDLELILFWVLAVAPSVLLIIAGAVIHAKLPRRWMARFLVAGLLACIAYCAFGGIVAMRLFPPPYDEHFAGGRGLDLRGTALILGGFAGAAAGAAATLGTFGVSAFLARWRAVRTSS
ncbi:hypothetical protein [Paenarthrobacter sp. NPDC090522]|uniref:hypothetical protein n=1 Tax=Paenarthrobacter sp. NPDC090522 TaxID=3364383 RepID=UPI00380EC636